MPTVNMNYSYSSGIKATLPIEGYMQRHAIENVEPNLGYMKDADMIEQPKNNGKIVQFYRYTELPAVTEPLYEGVTPDGQQLTETAFSVMTKNYGGWMAYTDELDLWHITKKTQAIAERLTRQARLSIDTAGRNAICAGLNVMYAGANTSRGTIASTDILTYAIIKKVVRNLKIKGAQPFADGYFHGKISHETYYDLTNDTHWDDANKYQDKSRESKYELGCLYKVKFFEVDNPMIFTAQSYLYGTTASLDAPNTSPVYDRTTRTLTVSCSTMTSDLARQLTGMLVDVDYYKSSTHYKTPMCIERITWDSSYAYVQFRWQPASSVTDEWTYAQTVKILPTGGGSGGTTPVHASLIYGQHAFGMVKLGGKGKPNIRIIVKPLGSSGDLDPLEQRGSIAWKVPFFCAAVIQDDFICRIEHGVTA